jgi:outer membrane biosynthesis protein TonB
MRKASRIYKRKSRSNLETFIILIGAIIILGVAFNLARDRSYIPPEEPTIVEEEKVESPVIEVPVELPQKETVEKVEEKEKFPEEEMKKEVTSEEKPPLTEPSVIETPAQNLAKGIRDKGYQTYVVKGKTLYKVQVGKFKSSQEAQNIVQELKELGCPNDIFVTTR